MKALAAISLFALTSVAAAPPPVQSPRSSKIHPTVEHLIETAKTAHVWDDADENDESKHGENVELLRRDEGIHEPQADESACPGERDGKEDNERIREVSKEGGHEQVRDSDGQEEIPLERAPSLGELIGRPA